MADKVVWPATPRRHRRVAREAWPPFARTHLPGMKEGGSNLAIRATSRMPKTRRSRTLLRHAHDDVTPAVADAGQVAQLRDFSGFFWKRLCHAASPWPKATPLLKATVLSLPFAFFFFCKFRNVLRVLQGPTMGALGCCNVMRNI